MKKLAQPTRSFFTLKISWKTSLGWLQLVFLFGSEYRADQLKKPPCMMLLWKLKFRGSQILSLWENVGDYSRVGEDAGGAKTSWFRRSTHCILHHHVAALSVLFKCFSILGAGLEPGLRHFRVNQQFLLLQVEMSSSTPPLPSPYLVSHWLVICIGEIAAVVMDGELLSQYELQGTLAMNASL